LEEIMKKLILLVVTILVLSPLTLRADPLEFVASGGCWTMDQFESVGGGFLLGSTVSLDASRDIYLRTLFHEFFIGDEPSQSILVSVQLYYNLGRDYRLAFNAGGEDLFGEGQGTGVVGGVGLFKSVWVGKITTKTVFPWRVRLFFEIDFTSFSYEESGPSARTLIGITFSPEIINNDR
jgi:hypothetical protein